MKKNTQKCLEYKTNYHRVNHFFLLNSTNVPLLLSTISDIYAKLENETELISFNTSLISE